MHPDTPRLLKQIREDEIIMIHRVTWNVPESLEFSVEVKRMETQIREDVIRVAKELERTTTLKSILLDHVPEFERKHYGKILLALIRNDTVKHLHLEKLTENLFPTMRLCDLLKENETIESLSIDNCYMGGLDCILDALGENKSVKSLAIRRSVVNDEKARLIIEFLRDNTRVKSLWLSRNCMTKNGIVNLLRALHNNVTLERLYLVSHHSDAKVEKEEYFALFQQNCSLKELRTDDFEILYPFTDNQMEIAVATLRRPTHIQVFENCYDEDFLRIRGFMELRDVHSDIRKLPEAAFLLIVKNLLFTDFGRAVLERARKEGLFA